MFSLHAQLTRDSAPDARYKKLLLNSVVCWACALVACYIPALYLVQASSTEFSGSDFKVSLWFQPPPATFGELICDPFLPFLSANVSPVPPKVISSLSLALRLKLLARSVRVRVLLLEFVSTFLFRLVPTLVSLVSSVCSLSALFLSSWFLARLVGFGYLAFTQRQTLLGVFLLFLPLPCCLFHLFFVASFCLFMAFYAVGTGSAH